MVSQVKVARYLQIENKIRALLKYEMAAEIPLRNKVATLAIDRLHLARSFEGMSCSACA